MYWQKVLDFGLTKHTRFNTMAKSIRYKYLIKGVIPWNIHILIDKKHSRFKNLIQDFLNKLTLSCDL